MIARKAQLVHEGHDCKNRSKNVSFQYFIYSRSVYVEVAVSWTLS